MCDWMATIVTVFPHFSINLWILLILIKNLIFLSIFLRDGWGEWIRDWNLGEDGDWMEDYTWVQSSIRYLRNLLFLVYTKCYKTFQLPKKRTIRNKLAGGIWRLKWLKNLYNPIHFSNVYSHMEILPPPELVNATFCVCLLL
jgi:hypothetical protein